MTINEIINLPTTGLVIVDDNTGEIISEEAWAILGETEEEPVHIYLNNPHRSEIIEVLLNNMRQENGRVFIK